MNENELVTLLERGWDCCTRLTVASDPHDIVTELFGVGLGHGVHPSSSVPRRHRLDVTYRCSSPVCALPACQRPVIRLAVATLVSTPAEICSRSPRCCFMYRD